MEWRESIEHIQKAQENNRLVIFVGAGVSKNSNLPSWYELIERIAEKIGYNKYASSCEDCSKTSCKAKKVFTQDEFLRIPEYFYAGFDTEHVTEYYQFIQNALKSDNGSNPIDNEIFKVLPHHIITTNYDQLLEKSDELNTQLYAVVSKDSDLLSKSSDRYIIKMHGDIEHPDTIILKESDYIDYEQNHPLISTFIRSLLINHTFVFLGYSLNDYNLKLIIGWINYYAKMHKIGERPYNFLLTPDEPSDFEKKRFELQKIYSINLSSLTDEVVNNAGVPSSLTDHTGQKLYTFLKCITDSELRYSGLPLAEMLSEKYQVLNAYRKISYEDLIRVQTLGRTEFMGSILIFYDKEWYDNICKILDKNHNINYVFNRAGLTNIGYNNNLTQKIQMPEDINMEFILYFENEYIKLNDQIELCDDTSKKIYYYHLMGKNLEEVEKVCDKESHILDRNNYISILLHKMRTYIATITLSNRQESKRIELKSLFETAPAKYHNAIQYLHSIFNSMNENLQKMQQILENHEKRYQYNCNSWYSGDAFVEIFKLQAFAYDYYFFFKGNNLPLDYFREPVEYFEAYIKAILCTYSPATEFKSEYKGVFQTNRKHYVLNDVDLDIFIKYTDSKLLTLWFNKYSVQTIEINDSIDVFKKYINLCSSCAKLKNEHWIEQVLSFSKIVCLMQLSNEEKQKILEAMVDLCEAIFNVNSQFAVDWFDIIFYLIIHLTVNNVDDVYNKLLNTILNYKVYSSITEMKKSKLIRIIKKLAPFAKNELRQYILESIDSINDNKSKLEKIYLVYPLFPVYQFDSIIIENMDLLDIEKIFHLIIDKAIQFSEMSKSKFLQVIQMEDKQRRNCSGVYTYPDRMKIAIECCIILNLLGFNFDIVELKPYVCHSEFLDFMLNPLNFDYTKVDINNYMWQNLIYSSDYSRYFVDHKEQLLSEELEQKFRLGIDSKQQQKIVYGMLLDKDNLRNYGG